MRSLETVLLTGATGLLGRDVLTRLLAEEPSLRIAALVRDETRAAAILLGIPGADDRVTLIVGDLRTDSLELCATLR